MIALKSKREIELMREAGRKLKGVITQLQGLVRSGMSTYDLDREAETLIEKQNTKPAFKGYRGYPATVCISINEEVVHGIPSKKRLLKEGDLLSLDIGLIHEGYYSDAAWTWPVGKINDEAKKLIQVAHKALYQGMAQMKVGNRLGDVGFAVQSYVESNGFSVVRDFVGHGIGRSLHEEPQVPNFGTLGQGIKLTPGMVLALEPMVTAGGWEVDILDDQWTVVTRDNRLATHYEDTIAIMESGPENLTGAQNYQEV